MSINVKFHLKQWRLCFLEVAKLSKCCWCNEKEASEDYQIILFGKTHKYCSAYCFTMVGVKLGYDYIEKKQNIGCRCNE